jgi:hypothetical protein
MDRDVNSLLPQVPRVTVAASMYFPKKELWEKADLVIFTFNDPIPAGKPNVVVFLCDDLGLLDSTPYGATDVRTPNLQRLTDEDPYTSLRIVAGIGQPIQYAW